jgi:hypothetical protein
MEMCVLGWKKAPRGIKSAGEEKYGCESVEVRKIGIFYR